MRSATKEFKKFHHSFRSAFPDIHINVEETVSEGDLVVGYCKIKATHTGAGFGMESTGKPVAFEGMHVPGAGWGGGGGLEQL